MINVHDAVKIVCVHAGVHAEVLLRLVGLGVLVDEALGPN
jgi:hypothetical protein